MASATEGMNEHHTASRWRTDEIVEDEKKRRRNERRKSTPRETNEFFSHSLKEKRTEKTNIFIVPDHVLLLTQ